MRGILSKDQFLIYKERNGKKGHMVFKALMTSFVNSGNKEMISDDPEPSATRGIIVCLGWVPLKDEN